jgi:hypothetical protein
MGWATAWSFDRLRLWIEMGIDPALSRQRALLHAMSAFTLAFVWIYQGAVPKLLTQNGDESAMLIQSGIPPEFVWLALQIIGWGEILLGVLTLALSRSRWVFGLTIALMHSAIVGVIWNSPHYLTAAFNPVSLNLLMAVVALVGWLTCRDLPTARRCKRKPDGQL